MTLEASVSAGWINTVIAAAQQLGASESLLLQTAGISQKAQRDERWPIDDITRLWHAAEKCTGDPALGLKTGLSVSPASLNVVGFALQSAATLREALVMVQRFQTLISDGGRFQLLPSAHATWIVYHPRQGQLAFSPHQIEAVLAATVTLARWLTASHLHPLRVQFSQARLAALKEYHHAFHCPVEFEQAFSGILMDNALLDRPLPLADAQLAAFHTRYSAHHLANLKTERFSVPKLRQWIQQNLDHHVPKREQAAHFLGMSERTLARRLLAQHTSYETLLDSVRQQKAIEAVEQSSERLADIALALGFAESSTFYRAFKRWTGVAPAQWRQRYAKGPL